MAGARVRTLPAAVVPVAVGTAIAFADGDHRWGRATLAAIVALALQLGTNYANDYSDGVRGTDDDRVGPMRLVASGAATAGAVRAAAFVCFGLAAVCGLALAAVAGWWLVLVGIAAVAAGWFYTGGPSPYGYMGLGELFVFVFFGVVATAGTHYVQAEEFAWLPLVASVPVGLLAVALLITNNLRDIPGDTVAGKRTVAVRIGDAATRRLYTITLVVALLVGVSTAIVSPGALLVLASVPLAVGPIRLVNDGALGRHLIAVLAATGRLQLAFGVAYAIGLAFG